MPTEAALPPPVATRRPLGDAAVVAVVLAVVLGAWVHRPVAVPVVVLALVALAGARHRVLLVLTAAALSSGWAARAWSGLDPPDPGPVSATVSLVADPVETPWGARADVRYRHHRFELDASGAAAGGLLRSLAGERVHVEGRVRPPGHGRPWLVPRHVVGLLAATRVERVAPGSAPWRAANRVRRLIERGAAPLPADTRALYLGFVLGEDRGQPPEIVDDFRGAGLTHLLVVSGENVH